MSTFIEKFNKLKVRNLLSKSIQAFKNQVSNNFVPSWIIFQIDLGINLFSIVAAYALRFNFQIPSEKSGIFQITIVSIILIKSIIFYLSRTHVNVIRHSSIRDLFKIFTVVLFSSIAVLVLNTIGYFIVQDFIVPLSVLLIDFFIAAYSMVMIRMIAKIFLNELKANNGVTMPTIMVGIDELALSVKRAFDMDPETNYKFVAFIDTEKEIPKRMLDGVDIYNYKRIETIIRRYNVKTIIIAKNQISPALKNHIVEKCLKHNVKVMSVSNVNSWINGEVNVKQIKNIRIEDLLERDPINLDTKEIRRQLENKTIMVTGAAGSIGSEIVRQIRTFNPYKIILLDQGETPLHNIELELDSTNSNFKAEIMLADIANPTKLKQIFETHKIDVIYHAAAYKHVPMMERHPSEAVKNNVYGTKLLADFAVKYKVPRFVMISTDKAVNPTNVMGASKRIAEIYVQSLNEFGGTSFITTRFGNVLGSNGSVIPLFKKQIENGGPVTVTDPEVCRFFMTIPEACQLVLEASVMGKGGEIFIFDMGKSVKISDLAKNMIRLAGLIPGRDIEIKYTGLRPGEKLYEELLAKEENTLPTYHPKIMIAKVQQYDFETVSLRINKLVQLAEASDNMQIVSMMKQIVPEYKSHNSIFKVLDSEKKTKNVAQFEKS